MKLHTHCFKLWPLLVAMILGCPSESTNPRMIVVISDLHMGLGQTDGTYDRKEDFRWSGALRGFLSEMSKQGNNQVDLVIAGDFLELWQAPPEISCIGSTSDMGCTVDEVKSIALRVAEAHRQEFSLLSEFSRAGNNKVYIIPGNHDSSLTIQEVWSVALGAFGADSVRVSLVENGLWTSDDQKVVVEHGHQIGNDLNRYTTWPNVTARREGKDYLLRPWGELFVQRLFNKEEEEYSIIDNLSPETAGARYRMADRGLWETAEDVARLVVFNLYETSISQKIALLGPGQSPSKSPCSRDMGFRLFADALDTADPFRAALDGDSAESLSVRSALDEQAKALSEEDFLDLCDLRSANQKIQEQLGKGAEKLVPRYEVLRQHLKERIKSHGQMKVFVYGHTHQLEQAKSLRLAIDRSVTIANSGAFQRLIDDDGFLKRSEAFDSPADALRQLTPEDLAPCYGVVRITYVNGEPTPEADFWWMEEGGKGEIVSPGATRCQ